MRQVPCAYIAQVAEDLAPSPPISTYSTFAPYQNLLYIPARPQVPSTSLPLARCSSFDSATPTTTIMTALEKPFLFLISLLPPLHFALFSPFIFDTQRDVPYCTLLVTRRLLNKTFAYNSSQHFVLYGLTYASYPVIALTTGFCKLEY